MRVRLHRLLPGVALGAALCVAALTPRDAQAGVWSNYLQNKVLDFVFRGQAFTPAATLYVALATTAGSQAACGTEVSGGSYARVAIASSLINWSGTQGSTTTAVSSGTSGTISNNVMLTFPSPTASWGTVTNFCIFDASTGGNLYVNGALVAPRTIASGSPQLAFMAAALSAVLN